MKFTSREELTRNQKFRWFSRVPAWAALTAALVTGAYGQGQTPSQPGAQAPLPNPPSNVTATVSSSSEIMLSWTASPVSGVTYNVYESTTSGFQPSTSNLIASGITGTTFTQQGLQPATTYYFVVSTEGLTFAPQVSATTLYPSAPPATGNPPAQPAFSCQVSYSVSDQWSTGFTGAISVAVNTSVNAWDLTFTWPGNQQITDAWNANATQTGASVSMSNASWNGTLQPGVILSGIGFTASYSGTNPTPAAISMNGATCTPMGSSNPPAPPTNLSATVLYGPEIDLSWTPSTTVGVTYNVYSSTSAQLTPSPATLIASGLAATEFPNEFLAIGTTYYYVVTAVNAYGESAPSNMASGLTHAAPANPPAGPTNLSATAVSPSEIDLTWTDSMGGAGATYVIYASTTPNFTPSAATRIAANIAVLSFQNQGLSGGTTYYYLVTRLVDGAESQPSNFATATTPLSLVTGCQVTYVDQSDWGSGFTGALSITNTGTTSLQDWSLAWTFSGNQQIYGSWNAAVVQTGANVAMTNEAWNGTISPGATLAGIGFNANYSGVNTAPMVLTLNGVACQ
jgi:fibronectin type 3 domain-containing protein